MDINQIGQKFGEKGVTNKSRQKNDFSGALRKQKAFRVSHKQPGPSGTSPSMTPTKVDQSENAPLISLGTVSRNNPNVSSLLIKHPVYRKECWRIVHSEVNRQKPYTRIQSGTEIFLDPKTKELVWGEMRHVIKEPTVPVKKETVQANEPQFDAGSDRSLSERLVGAVEPYIGRPYEEMNCYELLVKGLTNLGVRYQGSGGLGRKLISMAREKGLPMYALFNGEGLVEASGTPVYSKTLQRVKSHEIEAGQVLKEMEPYLEKGQILSFSIHTRGHTGIISQDNDTWTYINSGDMNNSLTHTGQPKGVGEESLEAEMANWFELAQSRGESLRITLGRLNEQKLVHFRESDTFPSEKV